MFFIIFFFVLIKNLSFIFFKNNFGFFVLVKLEVRINIFYILLYVYLVLKVFCVGKRVSCLKVYSFY